MPTLTKGNLLVAEPSVVFDKSFNRSVILLTEHNKNSSVGFILNKKMNYRICDLIPEIDCDFFVYEGGPVEKENLYFVHRIPHLLTNSIKITDHIFWGGDFDELKSLLNSGKVKREEIRFFLGYSGWSPNQLTEELDANSWICLENKYENVFASDSKTIWKNELLKLGGKYKLWINTPENPKLN